LERRAGRVSDHRICANRHDKSSVKFVPPPQRIAVFDNDGTLWASHPIYVQLAFALDRVKALAPQHPEWKTKQPFKAVLKGDLKTVMAGGEHGLLEIIMKVAEESGWVLISMKKDWKTIFPEK
jgi:hypothetical protein